MPHYAWDEEKNAWLIASRGIGFERIVVQTDSGGRLDVYEHPNRSRYPGQQMLVVLVGGYAYLVPCVESGGERFLKTIIPSRKATRATWDVAMKKTKLSDEESELLASFEHGEWQPAKDRAKAIARHRAYARNTLRKDARVNIRISSQDLERLKAAAAEDGIPYQTLLASVLHRYVAGRLIDVRPR